MVGNRSLVLEASAMFALIVFNQNPVNSNPCYYEEHPNESYLLDKAGYYRQSNVEIFLAKKLDREVFSGTIQQSNESHN